MKKLFTLALLVIALTVGAQEPGFVPTAGSYSVEVQLNPFNKNGISLVGNAIKGRYFLTDKHAVTLSLGLDCDGDITYHRYADNTLAEDAFLRWYTGEFNFDLGYQYHLSHYKRFDPFVGASIGLSRNFAGGRDQSSEDHYISWDNITPDGEYIASTDLRAAAFAGFDFYVYKGLFVGTEVGLGFEKKFYSDTRKREIWPDGAEGIMNETENAGGPFKIGFYVIPGIRLGWTF